MSTEVTRDSFATSTVNLCLYKALAIAREGMPNSIRHYELFIRLLRNASSIEDAERLVQNNISWLNTNSKYKDKALVEIRKKRLVYASRDLIQQASPYWVVSDNPNEILLNQPESPLADAARLGVKNAYQLFRSRAHSFVSISQKLPEVVQQFVLFLNNQSCLINTIDACQDRFKAMLKMAFLFSLTNTNIEHYFILANTIDLTVDDKLGLLLKRIEKVAEKKWDEPYSSWNAGSEGGRLWLEQARIFLERMKQGRLNVDQLQKIAICQAEQQWHEEALTTAELIKNKSDLESYAVTLAKISQIGVSQAFEKLQEVPYRDYYLATLEFAEALIAHAIEEEIIQSLEDAEKLFKQAMDLISSISRGYADKKLHIRFRILQAKCKFVKRKRLLSDKLPSERSMRYSEI